MHQLEQFHHLSGLGCGLGVAGGWDLTRASGLHQLAQLHHLGGLRGGGEEYEGGRGHSVS